MSPRLLWILLAVSLALNLSFVGAWGYSALVAPQTLQRANSDIEGLAEHLLLSPEQRDGLVELRKGVQERWRNLSGSSGNLSQLVVGGLAAESFDRDAMQDMVAARMTARAEVVAASMADLHAYLQTLSGEQRQAFLELAKQRGFLRGLFRGGRRDKRN